MGEIFTADEVHAVLQEAYNEAGTQRKLADAAGVVETEVYLALKKRRQCSRKLLAHLGFRRVVHYEAFNPEAQGEKL